DDNLDHLLDAHDQAWSDLLVWRDVNQDGHSQTGELTTLAQQGIAMIGLATTANGQWQGENQILTDAMFTRIDGRTGGIHEVDFAVHPEETIAGHPAEMLAGQPEGTISLHEAVASLLPETCPASLMPDLPEGGYFDTLESAPVAPVTAHELDQAIVAMITPVPDGPQAVAETPVLTDHASEVLVTQSQSAPIEDPLHPHTVSHGLGG
ncbi:MAG: hypothetical protein HQL86_08335, partial [Magnetococcales bacterium]|nr:hypothetical protein [Magnetococcales bacterium]